MKPIPHANSAPGARPYVAQSALRGAARLALTAALLAAITALVAISARPAAAQSGKDQYDDEKPSGLMVEVTGTLERLDPDLYGYGEYLVVDEQSGQSYALDDGDQGLLEPYVGQRVTVTGTEPAASAPPTDPRLLNVLQVEPAGESPEGPASTGSITFEVDTEGAVPAGTKFFGVYGEPTEPYGEIPPFGELGVINLHDSDHDGTYTATADVPEGESLALIASGDTAGPQQQIHPQSVIQRDATITVSGNELVSTTISFPDSGPASHQYDAADAPESEPPREDPAGGNGEPRKESSGPEIAVLPDTGGIPAAPAGALLAGGTLTALGLIVRRAR